MKALNLYFLLFLSGYLLEAQNLVPNDDFEFYTTCPMYFFQIDKAFPWYNPTSSSPDYFNTCNDSVFSGDTYPTGCVPQNMAGYQSVFSGVGYAGLAVYWPNDVREYIQIQLTQKLTAGKNYYVEFFCNTADARGQCCMGGCNNLGLAFSDTAFTKYFDSVGNPYGKRLTLVPAIYSDSIITDTVGWTKISGTYVALGTEEFITIGNFFSNAQTRIVNVTNPGGDTTTIGAYYYIEDVFVGLADTTGVDEQNFSVEDFKIYPNPSNSVLVIESEFLNTSIIISDVLGKQVKQFYTVQKRTEISIADLSQGIYFVRSKNCVKKLIVER